MCGASAAERRSDQDDVKSADDVPGVKPSPGPLARVARALRMRNPLSPDPFPLRKLVTDHRDAVRVAAGFLSHADRAALTRTSSAFRDVLQPPGARRLPDDAVAYLDASLERFRPAEAMRARTIDHFDFDASTVSATLAHRRATNRPAALRPIAFDGSGTPWRRSDLRDLARLEPARRHHGVDYFVWRPEGRLVAARMNDGTVMTFRREINDARDSTLTVRALEFPSEVRELAVGVNWAATVTANDGVCLTSPRGDERIELGDMGPVHIAAAGDYNLLLADMHGNLALVQPREHAGVVWRMRNAPPVRAMVDRHEDSLRLLLGDGRIYRLPPSGEGLCLQPVRPIRDVDGLEFHCLFSQHFGWGAIGTDRATGASATLVCGRWDRSGVYVPRYPDANDIVGIHAGPDRIVFDLGGRNACVWEGDREDMKRITLKGAPPPLHASGVVR
ncbi:MAG: hypothetical protein AB7E83_13825 [Ramlibacter sp.]